MIPGTDSDAGWRGYPGFVTLRVPRVSLAAGQRGSRLGQGIAEVTSCREAPLPVQSGMRVPAAAAAVAALGELAARAASLRAAAGGDLLSCFAAVPDPRDPRGVRHSLASVLAMSAAAVLCGCTSLADVTAWITAAPQQVLAAAGCRRGPAGACIPPHPDTVVRVFTLLGAGQLAGHAGAFLARRAAPGPVTFPVAGPGWLPGIAVDGKAVRGAAGPDGLVPYLLAAATHDACAVIAERLTGPKTNEVVCHGRRGGADVGR